METESRIGRDRERLLEEVRQTSSAPQALEKLAYVRREYDWAITEYRNLLSIVSDKIYQDRKHFLLELIQNADDAQFSTDEAMLTFCIFKDSIELRYNEIGFNVEDVIAITGAGSSTKTGKKRLSHSFIGEKGIGFKSVFALASVVEIESPPWHFLLRKEKCIVPEIVNSGIMTADEGTRLRVTFSDASIVNAVAHELDRYVSGEVESLLFLQRLSCFKVEDHRCSPPHIRKVTLSPANGSGNVLTLSTYPDKKIRDYVLYHKDEEFPAHLVAERWERIGSEIGPLKRKVMVAAIVDATEHRLSEGRVFCFLPTKIKLPVPLFIQVDGHTKADRERLHDPEQNRWNHHLLSVLPQFLLEALLAWRSVPAIATRLPIYIPTQEGTDQLAPVFCTLMSSLRHNAWVRTLHEHDEWVSPDKAIMAEGFWGQWFVADAQFRNHAEHILKKRFVHPDWVAKREFKEKLHHYGVSRLDENQIAAILEHAPLPHGMLHSEESLLGLYRELLKLPSLSSSRTSPGSVEIKERLGRAPIFPLERGGFGSLNDDVQEAKVFWLSVRTRRDTGLGGTLEYRIVDPEYTYRAEPGSDPSAERITECRRINERNDVVKTLLRCLDVPELTDESILSNLQIPWLINANTHSHTAYNVKIGVLSSIFESYRAKRIYDENYVAQLSRIADAVFLSEDGNTTMLQDLVLPVSLRLKPEDHFYANNGWLVLSIPDKLLGLHGGTQQQIGIDKERERQEKLRGDWRQFLVYCGIKVAPKFKTRTVSFNNIWDFERKDVKRFNTWSAEIGRDYTASNQVTLHIIDLDYATKKVIESQAVAPMELSAAMHQFYLLEYGDSLSTAQNPYPVKRQRPGNCIAEYIRYGNQPF